MPVPDFDHNGVIPPHIGNHATNPAFMSPFACTNAELCAKLGNTNERRQILLGFFQLRQALRQLGVASGFQWLDGSFTEDAERVRGRAPRDIDVVTFFEPQISPLTPPDPGLIHVITNHNATKAQYHVDHIMVPLAPTPDRVRDARQLVENVRYWFGLFSHRRDDDVWKGMLLLELDTVVEDAQAINTIRAQIV